MTRCKNPLSSSATDAEEHLRFIEVLISNLLRTCVVVSMTLIVVGSILSFSHHPQYAFSSAELQRLTQPGAAFPHTLREVMAGVLGFHGQAVVAFGLLLLIVTPVVRVAVSILAFFQQGDCTFTFITLAVLCLLLLSFLLGSAG